MSQAEIGLIGLGVMGANLALNIAEKGHVIAVHNRTTARTGAFFEAAGELRGNIVPCAAIEDFVRAIRRPRAVILMVPAGEPVDEQVAALQPLLADGDVIVDAGNANFRDTIRRCRAFAGTGLDFLGIGVSGGEEGARHGPSIMAGGNRQAYQRLAPLLEAIAAHYHGEPCCAWVGPDGAGHFVKTIHNGIEYADMQMIAEVYGIFRDGLGMQAREIAPVFARWNEGRLNSYLIEITAKVLAASDARTGGALVDVILDRAGQKGTGRWAVIEAQRLGVPATAIEAAVAARSLSSLKDEREQASRTYRRGAPGAGRMEIALEDLEAALFAAKIAAYAQGFDVMAGASREFGWALPLAEIARIWRAGCIIRSAFLDTIAAAFDQDEEVANLLVATSFVGRISETEAALRRVVAASALAGIPVPALSAALAYLDGYRQARGVANLIQAQRDFFGAHSFDRIDEPGAFHGPWAAPS